jgi:restriction endonuclease S subunit
VGKQALATLDYDGWVAGTAFFRLRPGPTVDSRYLQQYLGHPVVRDWISRHASTAVLTLTLSSLRILPVLIPPHAAQMAIGNIMSALDDKAAVHREIVDVTEQLRDTMLPLLLTKR